MFGRPKPKTYTLKEVNQKILQAQIKTLDSIMIVSKERGVSAETMIGLLDLLIEDSVEKLRIVDAS